MLAKTPFTVQTRIFLLKEETRNENPFNLKTQSDFLKTVAQRLQEEPNTIVEIEKEQGNKTKWKPLYQQ